MEYARSFAPPMIPKEINMRGMRIIVIYRVHGRLHEFDNLEEIGICEGHRVRSPDPNSTGLFIMI
jgi:hypothetical protein